jgi:hypothetical protein
LREEMQSKELLQFKEDPQQGLFVRWVNKKAKEKGEKSKEERKELERQKELENYLKMEQKMKEQEMKNPNNGKANAKEVVENPTDPSAPISIIDITSEMEVKEVESQEIDHSNGLKKTLRGDRPPLRRDLNGEDDDMLGKRKVRSK